MLQLATHNAALLKFRLELLQFSGTIMPAVKMANTPYTVPIIAPDLRHEEMIQQTCDTLAYLDQVASDIFSRISRRVTENREKLAQLNGRIAVAEAKVNRIKGRLVFCWLKPTVITRQKSLGLQSVQ